MRCFEVGGASLKIVPGLKSISTAVSTSIEDGIKESDQEVANELRRAREKYLKSVVFSNEFYAQMIRENTPIKAEEVVASLLSEDLETIKLMHDMGPGKEINFQAEAIVLVHKAIVEGADRELLSQKLKALGVKL